MVLFVMAMAGPGLGAGAPAPAEWASKRVRFAPCVPCAARKN